MPLPVMRGPSGGPRYQPAQPPASVGRISPVGGSPGLPGFPGMPAFPGMPGGSPGGMPGTGGGFNVPELMPGGAGGSGGGMPGTGGGFGAGLPTPPGTGGGFGAGPLSNTVTPSSDIKELQDRYRQRLSNDPTQRAIDRSTSSIRDATSGLLKEAGGNASRRGISQSGIAQTSRGDIMSDAQRRIAGASADISLGRERDLDSMVMGGLPIMGAQDELGLRKQGLGLQQWSAQNQAEIARQQLGLQAQGQAQQGSLAMMDMWSKYLNMFR